MVDSLVYEFFEALARIRPLRSDLNLSYIDGNLTLHDGRDGRVYDVTLRLLEAAELARARAIVNAPEAE